MNRTAKGPGDEEFCKGGNPFEAIRRIGRIYE
jgi:hypothetical protein